MEQLFCKIEKLDITKPENAYDIQQWFEDEMFVSVYKDDYTHFESLLAMILYMRDVKHGRGIRYASYLCLQSLTKFVFNTQCNVLTIDEYVEFVKQLISVGSWRDIRAYLNILMCDDYCSREIVTLHIQKIIIPQLVQDRKNMSIGECASNLSKWLPREKSNYKDLAKLVAIEYCNYTHPHLSSKHNHEKYKIYRKLIAKLNKYIDTTQIHMCAREWDKIDFDFVTTDTIKKNHVAFSSPDWEHRVQCARNFENHLVKWASSPECYIHNQQYVFHSDYFNYIPCFLNDDPECVNIGMQMMDINRFKKGFTHSKTPSEINYDSSNIMNVTTTRNVSVSLLYQQVLKLAVEHDLSDEDVSKLKIVIVTKYNSKQCILPGIMQYENARKGVYCSFIDTITGLYRQYGYDKIPKIVFWNITRCKDPHAIMIKKTNPILNNTLVLRGFHKYAFHNPIKKKYLKNNNLVKIIPQVYENKIASIYKYP
jgi:hypothetical protein